METTMSITIDRPADEVFAYVADMSNNPHWQKGQQRCVWTSESPIGVGSTYDQEAMFLGRTITSSFRVSEFEGGRHIRIVTTGGTMSIDVARDVEPIDATSCTVRAHVRGNPPRLFKLLGPVTSAMLKRNVTADYQRLKALLESG